MFGGFAGSFEDAATTTVRELWFLASLGPYPEAAVGEALVAPAQAAGEGIRQYHYNTLTGNDPLL